MKPENSIRNKKVELAVSSVVFLYVANIVWYFLTGVFEWGDPLGVYLIFIANGILGLILYVAVSLICYRKIKISPNYEEAVLLQDYWIKWEDLCRAYGEDIETLLKYNPPYPELALHFTMRNYLWGKKDWIIQLGLLE